MKEFTEWMETDVGLNNEFLFVTCGDWDLKTMLPIQCNYDNIEIPDYLKTYLNIKMVSIMLLVFYYSIIIDNEVLCSVFCKYKLIQLDKPN